MTEKRFQSINPSTGTLLESYPAHSASEVDAILRRARDFQEKWRKTPFSLRTGVLTRLSQVLQRQKDSFAALMQAEMGKSLADAKAEVEKCASTALYYAEKGPGFLTDREVATEAAKSYVSFQPLGVVLTIMPWNFPFWQALRAAMPAILAGNTVLLKHASNVSGCSLALEKAWREASGEECLFQSLLISGESALRLIARPEIAAVSFTGSTAVGKKIAAQSGESLKKAVLELGGSDAYVVLADSDLDLAARICAKSRLINGGQSCIAAKRFIVEAGVYDSFLEKFARALGEFPLPPMAREDLRNDTHTQVERSVAEGARLLLGGKIPPGPGYFYPATLLADARPGMTAFDEEIFGPVATVVKAKNTEDALALANLSSFGLGGAVFTRDAKKGESIARDGLEAGSCFVNDFVRSDPRLPFGGIKESGFGRELSEFGLLEFVNVKTVWVGKA
jgi:succinate-semialdehyde dehydrogenase/glutarate-semialdehyde dehydrogenase